MMALLCLQRHRDGTTATAPLCQRCHRNGVTVMAPLCQRCHHAGCHHDGSTVPMLSLQWMSQRWHCCTSTTTTMDVTTMAALCQHCHCNGVTTMARRCHGGGTHHHDGYHRHSTAVPTLSSQWGHRYGTAVPTLPPGWASLRWHCCTSTITAMAPLCPQHHCDGYHHHGTAVPALSLQWGHHDGTAVPLPPPRWASP